MKFQTYNRKLKRKHNQASGFTLLEVMILLFVVAVMISGIIPLFLAVVRANTSAAYYARAYKDLDSQVEVYRKSNFDNLASGTFTVSDLPSGTGTVTVSNVIDGVGQADIREVDVKIKWTYQKQSQVEEDTYIYRNGLGK